MAPDQIEGDNPDYDRTEMAPPDRGPLSHRHVALPQRSGRLIRRAAQKKPRGEHPGSAAGCCAQTRKRNTLALTN
jgi:hypothetical protein